MHEMQINKTTYHQGRCAEKRILSLLEMMFPYIFREMAEYAWIDFHSCNKNLYLEVKSTKYEYCHFAKFLSAKTMEILSSLPENLCDYSKGGYLFSKMSFFKYDACGKVIILVFEFAFQDAWFIVYNASLFKTFLTDAMMTQCVLIPLSLMRPLHELPTVVENIVGVFI